MPDAKRLYVKLLKGAKPEGNKLCISAHTDEGPVVIELPGENLITFLVGLVSAASGLPEQRQQGLHATFAVQGFQLVPTKQGDYRLGAELVSGGIVWLSLPRQGVEVLAQLATQMLQATSPTGPGSSDRQH